MSEKLTSWSTRPKAHRAKSRIVALYTFIALIALTLWYRQPKWVFTRFKLPVDGSSAIPDDLLVDWDKITPSEELTWTPCFHMMGNFSCARLTVPMDYGRPLSESTENPKVHVALVLLPGKGHSELTGNFSESPLLLNPGGPGGSGTMFVVSAGVNLQKVIGPEQDLIGFDPRGIGSTWPQTDCFIDDHDFGDDITVAERNRAVMHRYTWEAGTLDLDLPNKASSQNLFKAATRSRAKNQLCKKKDGVDSIFKYTGTPHVAQDMLSIIQAWDRYTSKVKTAATRPKCAKTEKSSVEATDDGPPSTKGKLVFWGFSYGTFLGATFAAMFPDSVGRVVLDGVVDSDLYFHKSAWSASIRDADAILESFYPSCVEAGVECKLFRVGDREEDIREKFRTVLDYLEKEPFISVLPGLGLPGVLTISILKRVLFSTMYFPVLTFPLVALIVDLLYSGVGFSIASTPDLFPICGIKDKLIQYPEDSPIAIGCSDWRDQRRMTFPEYEKEYEKLSKTSSFADVWMQLVTQCNGWGIQQVDPPSMNWDGFPTGDKPPVNTSFPILFVSSTHDPVTPLQQALIMSQRFVDSGLIEQLSNGHTSLSAVSLCSLGKIKDYLGRGIVPDPPKIDAPTSGDDTITGKWTQCEADEKPWKPYSAQGWLHEADEHAATQENIEIMEAWRQVQQVAREMDHFSHMKYLPQKLRGLLQMDYDSAEMMLRSSNSEEEDIGSL